MMRRMLAVWVFCLVSLLSGCAHMQQQTVDPANQEATFSANEETSYSNELVLASPARMPIFDPFGTTKQEALLSSYEWLTYRGLAAYGTNELIVPRLAADVRIKHHQGNPLVELTLRSGLRWSDGQPITTDDVLFTYQTYARPDYYGVWRDQMHLIAGVSAFRSGKAASITGITSDSSQRTVRFALTEDRVSFLDALTAPLLPKHQAAGKSLDELKRLSQFGLLVGTGPYQPRQLGKSEWQFTANPHYYEGKPKIAKLRVVLSAQNQADLDHTNQNRAADADFAALRTERNQATKSHADHSSILTGSGNGYHFLGFNLHSAKLKNLSVRRALAQAISTKELAQQVFGGMAVQVKSLLSPATFVDITGQAPRYDLQAAQRALAEHGYSKQHPLTLTLHYPADNETRRQIVEFLVKSWEPLPVQIQAKPLSREQFDEYVFGGKPVDLYLYAWRYPRNPAELRSLFHSGEKVGELGLNASRYANPEADSLLVKSQTLRAAEAGSGNRDERMRLLTKWQQLMWTDLPILPLVETTNTVEVVSGKLTGLKLPLGPQPFENIHQWTLE